MDTPPAAGGVGLDCLLCGRSCRGDSLLLLALGLLALLVVGGVPGSGGGGGRLMVANLLLLRASLEGIGVDHDDVGRVPVRPRGN